MPSKLVALWCWYQGGAFRGYQTQLVGPTVQGTLLEGLRAAGFERDPVASGRTDLGVHARMQVLSLRVVEGVHPTDVAAKLNAVLPPTVGIACSREAPKKFNAAWCATGKEYRYRLRLAGADTAWAWRVDCDVDKVRELLARLPGTRDFSAFHDSSSAPKPRRLRTVELATLGGDDFEVRVVGDGFARYMVRFLVGAVVDVARGHLPEDTFTAALERAVPFTKRRAPPEGLILWDVEYPPAMDPFSTDDRRLAAGVPTEPPFCLTPA
jgi:tRNA pseudouridine38-40 synthase